MNKNIYVILAEGFEEVEALTPVDLLRRAGQTVRLVSLSGADWVVGSHGLSLKADCGLSDCCLEQAAMLVLPGGKRGTENLEAHAGLAQLLRQAAAVQLPLAAICAAPRLLGRLGLLQGRSACCYPGNEPLLLGARVCCQPVVIDGPVITSRGMGTALPFGLALVSYLCGAEVAEQLARAIVYPG